VINVVGVLHKIPGETGEEEKTRKKRDRVGRRRREER